MVVRLGLLNAESLISSKPITVETSVGRLIQVMQRADSPNGGHIVKGDERSKTLTSRRAIAEWRDSEARERRYPI